MNEPPADKPQEPWIVCTCGNLIRVGRGTLKGNREVREHPACGRKPNRIGTQPIPRDGRDAG